MILSTMERAVVSHHAALRASERDIEIPATILDKLDLYKNLLTEGVPLRFVDEGIIYGVALKNGDPVVVTTFKANYAERKEAFNHKKGGKNGPVKPKGWGR